MTNNLTLTDVNMTQSHGPKSSMPTNVLDGQILLGRTDGKPTEQFAGTEAGVETLANAEWQNVHGDIAKNEALQQSLQASNDHTNDGKLLFDSQTFDKIVSLRTSSFDMNKFIKIGTPYITDDGIFSHIASSGYARIVTDFLQNANTWEIKFNHDTRNATATWGAAFANFNATEPYKGLVITANVDGISFFCANGGGSGWNILDNKGIKYLTSERYNNNTIRFGYNGTNYYCYVNERNATTSTILNATENVEFSSTTSNIGYHGWFGPVVGSMDLKQLAIFVDGKEAFSGNKTGIDILKPNDFESSIKLFAYNYNDGEEDHTVYADSSTEPTELYNADGSLYTDLDFTIVNNEGTITVYYNSENACTYTSSLDITLSISDATTAELHITNDGIINGFNRGTGLNVPASYTDLEELATLNKKITIEGQIKTLPSTINTSEFVIGNGRWWNRLEVTKNSIRFKNSSDTKAQIEGLASDSLYKFKMDIIGGGQTYDSDTSKYTSSITYSLTVFDELDGLVGTNSSTMSRETASKFNEYISFCWNSKLLILKLGGGANGLDYNTDYYSRPMDLNTIKIYVNDKLIYQPLLRIPYTLSKDNMKIVDSTYRDRVKDAYEQNSKELYYTLQERQIDNYAITGSTVVDETTNIASSFNNSNYLTSNLTNITLDKLNIYGNFTTSTSFSYTQYIMAIASDSTNNNSLVRLAIDTNKRLGIGCHNNTSWTAYWSENDYIKPSTTYLYHIYYENGKLKLDVSTDSLVYTNAINQSITVSSSYAFNKLWLGSTGANNDTYFRGSIDLNTIKLTYDNVEHSIIVKPNYTLPYGNIYEKLENVVENNLDRINQSKMLTTGNIVNYEEEYKELEKAYYSNFDVSKYSPTGPLLEIDNNGIATNLNNLNYVGIHMLNSTITPKTFEFKIKYGLYGLDSYATLFANYTLDNNTNKRYGIVIRLNSQSNFYIYLGSDDNTNTWDISERYFWYDDFPNVDKENIEMKIGFTGHEYYVEINGRRVIIATTTKQIMLNKTASIGYSYNYGYPIKNKALKVDLSKLSMIIDNTKVFSGCKTSIDTIKPNDYIMHGKITIDDLGVASNFSDSNYLTKPINFYNAQSWKITTSFTTGDSFDRAQRIFDRIGIFANYIGCQINTNKTFSTFIRINGNDLTMPITVYYAIEPNTKYYIDYTYKNGTYTIICKNANNGLIVYEASCDSTETWTNESTTLIIGRGGGLNTSYKNTIDLNDLKIYKDDKLIYQPLLRIPYTLSKDNMKIVDSTYRDRVKDVYEQNFTTYQYFTIDENDKTYSLPQGNLYEMIESSKAETQSNSTGINAINQYKALETGNTSTSLSKVYNDIYKYKHSYFDISKFNFTGAYTLTNDGIYTATGNLWSSRFILPIKWGDLKGKSWKIKFRSYSDGTYSGGTNLFSLAADTSGAGSCRIYNIWDRFYWYVDIGDSSEHTSSDQFMTNTNVPSNPGWYDAELCFDIATSTYYFKVIDVATGETFMSSVRTATTTNPEAYVINSKPNNNINFTNIKVNNKQDFKYFSIEADGIEIFNGNTTGIDIIKQNNFSTLTGLFAYVYNDGSNDHTIYTNVTSNMTQLYNSDGSSYIGSDFAIANDTVNYLNYASYSSADNIIIGSTTYYAFKYDTHIIYANSSTSPTALYNNDGTAYTGTDWRLYQNTIAYLSPATYTQSSNIILSTENATVDAGVNITDDGVASNFSESKLLRTSAFDASAFNSLKIKCKAIYSSKLNTSGSNVQLIWQMRNSWRLETSPTAIYVNGFTNKPTINLTMTDGDIIEAEVTITRATVVLDVYVNGEFYSDSKDNNDITLPSVEQYIDITSASSTYYFTGSIDLNAFKIYLNDNLIYQPMLRIPYTQSATKYGSKIVDSNYSNRVEDAYEQNFTNRYYIINETNKTAALPKGELYGMLEQCVQLNNLREVKCVIDTYNDGTDWYRVWSDGWCEQGGQANENVDVAFLKPFTNTNYTITATRQFSSDNNNVTYYDKRTNYIQFRVSNDATGSSVISWMACGYIA